MSAKTENLIDNWITARAGARCLNASGVLECTIETISRSQIDALSTLESESIAELIGDKLARDLEDGDSVSFRLLTSVFRDLTGWRHYETLDDLVSDIPIPSDNHNEWYLHEYAVRSTDDNVQEVLSGYYDTGKLGELLLLTSDHVTGKYDCHFLSTKHGHVHIPISYRASDIVDIADVSNVMEALKSDDVRIRLFRNALVSNCSLSSSVAFADVLSRYHKVVNEYETSYRLYLDRRGLDKLLEQYESSRINYVERITSVFSDLQIKLFSIPTALILVVTQLDFGAGMNGKNLGVFIGSIAYGFVLSFGFSVHKSTIGQLYRELIDLENSVRRLLGLSPRDQNKVKPFRRMKDEDEFESSDERLAVLRGKVVELKLEHRAYLRKVYAIYVSLWAVPLITLILMFVD